MRARRQVCGSLVALAVGIGALVGASATATAQAGPGGPRYTAGAAGAGDAYFPFAGNGGYDVRHYDLDLTYTPPAPAPAPLVGQLERRGDDRPRGHAGPRPLQPRPARHGRAGDHDQREARERGGAARAGGHGRGRGVLARPGRRGPRVGADASSPDRRSRRARRHRSSSPTAATTTRPEDIEGALYGWVTTRDGAMVVGEPEGSMTWYPVSDHQTDKATYGFEITVPEGKVAVANGLPAGDPVTEDGWTTWFWDAPDPQASYLTTASVGDYDLRTSETAGGLPIIDAVDDDLTPGNAAATEASLALQGGHDRLPGGVVRGRTRSSPTARSSTTTPSATRSRRRPGPCTPGRPARAPSCTSWPTSGSGTR